MINPAILAAGASANAARQTAKQALLGQFTKARSYEPSSAITLAPEGLEAGALTEMVGLAIVRPLGDGRYYLDRDRQKERAAQQVWIVLAVLLGFASVLASLFAIAASR